MIVQEEDWRAISHLLSGQCSVLCQEEARGRPWCVRLSARAREPDESSRITCAYYIHTRCPHLRHHVSNTQCRRFVDPLLPVAHRSSSSLVHPTGLIWTEKTQWDELESQPAIFTRKEHLCDPTLLSLREVLRHKVLVGNLQGRLSSSITVSCIANNVSPSSAWVRSRGY